MSRLSGDPFVRAVTRAGSLIVAATSEASRGLRVVLRPPRASDTINLQYGKWDEAIKTDGSPKRIAAKLSDAFVCRGGDGPVEMYSFRAAPRWEAGSLRYRFCTAAAGSVTPCPKAFLSLLSKHLGFLGPWT